MEIKYLKGLNNYLTFQQGSYFEKLEPTSMDEIISLENLYNGGRPFPTALRELLAIAGGNCYVLDYGRNRTQTQLQESAREDLVDNDLSISRPFYVVDIYNAHDMFVFVYIDENKEDPIIHEAVFEGDERGWIHSLNMTLSQLIDRRLKRYLSGINPF